MADKTPRELPATSYIRDPAEPFSPADEVFRFAQLSSFYDAPNVAISEGNTPCQEDLP